MFKMALGPFRFSLPNVPIVAEGQETSARFARLPVGLAVPKKQFLGANDDVVTISATIYPKVLSPAGPNQVAAMRIICKIGLPMPFLSSGGAYLGMFVIEKVGSSKTHHDTGATAQKITVDIELSELGS